MSYSEEAYRRQQEQVTGQAAIEKRRQLAQAFDKQMRDEAEKRRRLAEAFDKMRGHIQKAERQP